MAGSGDGHTTGIAATSSSLCAICLQGVKDARALSCLHSFCKSCIDDLDMMTGHKRQVTCPLCRFTSPLPEHGASALPKDITRTAEQEQECDTCKQASTDGKPEMWCGKCDLAFCKEHVLNHALSSGHAVSPILTARDGGTQSGHSSAKLCATHKHPIRYFCKMCGVWICGDCVVVGDHNGHKPIVTAKEIAQELQQSARCKTERLETVDLLRLENSLSSVDDVRKLLSSRADKCRSLIRAAETRAIHTIQAVVQQKLTEVDDLETMRLKELDQQHDEIKRHTDNLKGCITFGERLFQQLEQDDEREDAGELFLALNNRSEAFGKVRLQEEPGQHAGLAFKEVNDGELLAKAKEMVGEVVPRPASANHSSVDESHKRSGTGMPVSFVVVAKDDSGKRITKGGDAIEARWLEVPRICKQPPSPKVVDKNNGTYLISYTPHQCGDYVFEVNINGDKLYPSLSFSYVPLIFNRTECQNNLEISEDQLTVTCSKFMDRWLSVLGSVGMKTGHHSWKVRVTTSKYSQVYIGLAERPGLTADTSGDNRDRTYSWYGWNGNAKITGTVRKNGMTGWKENDVLHFDLDCDAHVLCITNHSNGQKDKIERLPNAELFPYFALYNDGDSLTIVA